MESQASISRVVPPKKTQAPRRSWTVEEEHVLLHALKELVVRGWKCDNGFKAGYQGLLEKSMLQAFPGTDLKAEPHINSKIIVWKKTYGSLSTMMSRTGFGWNDTTNTITVENDNYWNEYVKTDKNARGMRYKSWPYYNDWCTIFGKDRATDQNAEGFAEVIQDILSGAPGGAPTAEIGNNAPRVTPEPFTPVHDSDTTSVWHGDNNASNKSKSSKKRKTTDDTLDDRFLDLMASFYEKADSRLGDLAKRLGFEQDERASRKEVFAALANLTFLSAEDKLAVAKQLCNNTKDMDLFFSLNDEMKAKMASMIVSGRL